jgi:hypothetical protein
VGAASAAVGVEAFRAKEPDALGLCQGIDADMVLRIMHALLEIAVDPIPLQWIDAGPHELAEFAPHLVAEELGLEFD